MLVLLAITIIVWAVPFGRNQVPDGAWASLALTEIAITVALQPWFGPLLKAAQ